MGARAKLNRLHLSGDVTLAAVAGTVAGSWLVFFVALVIFVGIDVHTGQIRPAKNRQRESAPERTKRRNA